MATINGTVKELQKIKGTVRDKNRISGAVAAILLQGAGGGMNGEFVEVTLDDESGIIDLSSIKSDKVVWNKLNFLYPSQTITGFGIAENGIKKQLWIRMSASEGQQVLIQANPFSNSGGITIVGYEYPYYLTLSGIVSRDYVLELSSLGDGDWIITNAASLVGQEEVIGYYALNGDIPLRFIINEVYTMAIMQADATLFIDETYPDQVPGARKTMIIEANGFDLTFGDGMIVLSGTWDNRAGNTNQLDMIYSEFNGALVTITSLVIGEDVEIKAPIPSDDSKVDKLEGYSLVSDTEIAKIHERNTDDKLVIIEDGEITGEVKATKLNDLLKIAHEQYTDGGLGLDTVNEVSAAELRGVVDFANIATPPAAYQIPVVQDITGVKSLKYSDNFVFENGTLKVKGAGNTTGKTLSIFNLAGTENFTILDNGSVGIGTATPTFAAGGGLQIYHGTQANIRFTNGNDSADFLNYAGDFYIINRKGTGNIKIRVNQSKEVITVISTEKVGINTTTPAKSLEVSHATGDCFRLSYDKSTTVKADFTLDSNGKLTIAAAGGHEFTGDVNLTGVLKIDGVQVVKEQQAAIANLITTFNTNPLTPTNDTEIDNGFAPTVYELLQYCVNLEDKLETVLTVLRAHGLIAT